MEPNWQNYPYNQDDEDYRDYPPFPEDVTPVTGYRVATSAAPASIGQGSSRQGPQRQALQSNPGQPQPRTYQNYLRPPRFENPHVHSVPHRGSQPANTGPYTGSPRSRENNQHWPSQSSSSQQATPATRPQQHHRQRLPVNTPITRLPPLHPREQGFYDVPGMAPVMQQPARQEPASISQGSAAAGGSSDQEQFDQHYEFEYEEREWLLTEGMYLDRSPNAVKDFQKRFRERFGDERVPPSIGRMMTEFHRMRS